MTNKLEISRELLSHAAALLSSVHSDVAHQLTALLAAPVPPLIQTLHANGDRIAMEATIAQQAQRIADLEAAPVVERQCCTPTTEENELLANGDYTPEELWGGSMPTCPKCIKKDKAVERQEPVTRDQQVTELSEFMGRLSGGLRHFAGQIIDAGWGKTYHIHGVPIGYRDPEFSWATISAENKAKMAALGHDLSCFSDPLYAEQPVPVAVVSLRNFANAMIDIALEGCDADGPQIQELAVEHGLLKPEQRTERCGDTCSCAEYADFPVECFRKVKELNQ